MYKLVKYIKHKINRILNILRSADDTEKILTGKKLININNSKTPKNIEDIEFKIFSQFGDDGIIQFLINKIELDYKYHNFIEFGVENYKESNTRFLLLNNNWSGLIIDSSKKNTIEIKNSNYFWKHDLEVKNNFITRENINNIIKESKLHKEHIGILSIDIDGNDYWVWKEINVIDPIIVIIEYNSSFGFVNKVSIPYDENFSRTRAHHSNLYWGASLEALKFLANKKGYKFFSTNSAGNNAYFIKDSFYKKIDFVLKKNSYEGKFRESRDKNGLKTFVHYKDKLGIIKDLTVEDVEKQKLLKISELKN